MKIKPDAIKRGYEFVKNIHNDTSVKNTNLREILGIELANKEYENLKEVTEIVMYEAEKSDRLFLLWLHFVGNYIKLNYSGSWVLLNRELIGEQYFVPCVMGLDNEFWAVGDFCSTYYYKKNRMNGISFETFYKLEIDRVIWKPKYNELNIKREDIFYLEDK